VPAKGLGRCESRDLALRCRQRKERFVVVAANLPATWAKLVHGAFDFLVGAAVRIDMEPLPSRVAAVRFTRPIETGALRSKEAARLRTGGY